MTHLACCTPLLRAPPSYPRGRRPSSSQLTFFITALVLTGQGCREDSAPPTAPAAEPATEVTGALALAFGNVSTGRVHTCGVTTAKVAYCWGLNNRGQLGDGTFSGETCGLEDVEGGIIPCSTRPVRVVGHLVFRQVSAGGLHTCGVTTTDVIYCWGGNFAGQLGDGTNTDRPQPVRVVGGLTFERVTAGERHTCGVTTANVAYCWGENDDGRLGTGSSTGSSRPARVVGGLRFRQVSAGESHTCGVTTKDVAYCWGSNGGNLGRGTRTGPETCTSVDSGQTPCSTRPVRVVGGLAFARVNAGPLHTCGLTPHHVAYCWGDNSYGELGVGTRTGPESCPPPDFDFPVPCSTRPVRVVGNLAFAFLNAGGGHTCGVTSSAVAYCWGINSTGELGIGTDTGPESCLEACSTRPVRVVGRLAFRGVQAGHSHTCGVTTNNVAYCWGDNSAGALGNGTLTSSSRPIAVVAPRS